MLIDFGVFLVLLSLLVVVLFLRTISILHRIYIALHLAFMVWALLQFSSQTTSLLKYKLLFVQSSYIVLSLISVGCYIFSLIIINKASFLKTTPFKLMLIPFVFAVIIIASNPSGMFLQQYTGASTYKVTQPGPLFVYFLAQLLFYGVVCLVLLYRQYRISTMGSAIRELALFAFKGISIIFIFGSMDIFVNLLLMAVMDRYYPFTSVGLMITSIYMIIQMNRTNVLDIINLAQRDVLNTISVGILVVDKDNIVVEMNEHVSSVIPIKVGEVFDEAVVRPFLSGDSWRKVKRWLSIRNRNPNYKLEFEIEVQISYTRFVLVLSLPIFDRKSKLIGYMYTFQDITENKKLIEGTKKQNQLLQQRNAELLSMQEELFESNRKLEKIAITDPLTECYNRRYLMQFLEIELHRNLTTQMPFTIIILDIDYFKLVNDSYGHLNGDLVLVHTAKKLESLLLEHDLLARFGGEEFIIYMPQLTPIEALQKAEQIKTEIEHNKVWIDDIEDYITVTISLGIVTIDQYDDFKIKDAKVLMNEIMTLADKALYEAKFKGRNLIVKRSIATI